MQLMKALLKLVYGKFGNPRTAANHSIPGKAEKAAKSGVPNFKSVDEIDRLINNNPYVGTSENNGLRNLRLLFNYIIKDKNEFMRRFNKYGFGTAVGVPTAATINNNDNGK